VKVGFTEYEPAPDEEKLQLRFTVLAGSRREEAIEG
jgi:hypothetical protein